MPTLLELIEPEVIRTIRSTSMREVTKKEIRQAREQMQAELANRRKREIEEACFMVQHDLWGSF